MSFRIPAGFQNAAMSDFPIRDLKARAQLLKPTVRLGKAGVTPEFLAGLNDALVRNRLVKVRFEGLKDERKVIARELAEKTGSRLLQQIGYTAVYYRESPGTEPAE